MWTYDEKEIDLLRPHFKAALNEFSQVSTEVILTKLLRNDLILHPRVRELVDQFKSNNFSGKTVGVHVRYTDHRTRLWATLKNLDSLLKQEPELQVVLSTDNLNITKMFEDNYRGEITTSHWYPLPGLNIHQNNERPDPIETGVEALIFDLNRRGKLPAPLRRLTWKIMIRLGLFSWGLGILRKFVRIQRLFNE